MAQKLASQQYKLLRADITADRLDDQIINIGQMIVEINLYEHLEKPYITGKIMIVDDDNVLDDLNFSGTETIELSLAGVANTLDEHLSRKFAIVGVERSTKTNDRVEVYVLNIIDHFAYLSYANRFSKSYTGKVEDIIGGIVQSQLGVELDRSYSSTSAQDRVKVIVPYLTPLGACDWLRNKITTINGSPWFLYASMFDNKLRLGDMDTLLTQEAFNKDAPFFYSGSSMNSAEEGNEVNKSLSIIRVRKADMDNTLDIIKLGGLAAKVSSTNLSLGDTSVHNYSVRNTLNRLKRNNVIPEGYEQNVFDATHQLDHSIRGKKDVDLYPSRFFHEISASNIYPGVSNLSGMSTPSELNNKASNASIRNLLYKNMIDVEVWGTSMFMLRIGVGDIARMHFQSSTVTKSTGTMDQMIDKNRSGDYMIYAMKHVFMGTTHRVSMSAVKLARRAKESV